MHVDDWFKRLPSEVRAVVEEIRRQKREGGRSRPSVTLMDRSALMTKPIRGQLLDAVACLVDENYAGRAEMCIQFAALLHRALSQLKFPSRPVVGIAIYYGARARGSISMETCGYARCALAMRLLMAMSIRPPENPLVPKSVSVAAYSGRSPKCLLTGVCAKIAQWDVARPM